MTEEMTAERIKAIRKRYGLSQQAFARILGIGPASMARYESGAKPSKAIANLIRAATIPEFMADCLKRDGDTLTPKQRESVEKIVYAEITFDEKGEIMTTTEIYELTLQQEVLNEKAAEIIGDVINGLIEAEERHDEGLKMVYEDIFAQLSLLKPTIASNKTANWESLSAIDGELNCMRSLFNRAQRRAA